MGADRIRREYNALGELINLNDAVGNQVLYTYNGSNQLTVVTEQGGSGRKFAISYSTTVKITDAGGEKTTYTDTSGNLTSVANPDGTSLAYTYGGCTGASSTQLCSATDGRGHPTDFTYSASTVGPASVATIVDRNSNTTTITYNSTNVTADRGIERTAYASIDASGQVGEVNSGSTANAWLSRTFYGWDTAANECRQPDAGVDNNLCFVIRRGLTPSAGPLGAPDRVTDYVYGDEGQMLSQRDIDYPTDLYTTAGYQDEYFEAGATVSAYTGLGCRLGQRDFDDTNGRPKGQRHAVRRDHSDLIPHPAWQRGRGELRLVPDKLSRRQQHSCVDEYGQRCEQPVRSRGDAGSQYRPPLRDRRALVQLIQQHRGQD